MGRSHPRPPSQAAPSSRPVDAAAGHAVTAIDYPGLRGRSHFPGGKQQLLVEAMGWMAERAARPLREALAAEPPPAPREVVAQLLERFRELLTMTGYRGGCPLVAGVADASWDSPTVADAARDAFGMWLAPLEQVLRRGGLPAQRSQGVALLVVSAAEGAVVISRARRDASALDAVQAELDLLLRELA